MIPVAQAAERVVVESFLDARSERRLADDVLDGLTRPFKEIAPKHFYDARGSELFDAICELPEYYPTRTERAILAANAEAIVASAATAELIELGAGSTVKARILLDAMAAAGTLARYLPMDVSETLLRAEAAALASDYRGLAVHGIVGDFERHLDRIPPPLGDEPRMIAFLGGTIGNFPPGSRRRLLREIARRLRPQDRLLLGADLVKDPAILEAAYDDAAGVTAEFNRNVLRVINRELGGDLDPDAFDHVAFYDREREWIEMRLRARRPMRARIDAVGLDVTFAPGEEVRTEISAKFTRERIVADFAAAGLALRDWLSDEDALFAVAIAAPDVG